MKNEVEQNFSEVYGCRLDKNMVRSVAVLPFKTLIYIICLV